MYTLPAESEWHGIMSYLKNQQQTLYMWYTVTHDCMSLHKCTPLKLYGTDLLTLEVLENVLLVLD